MTAYSPYSGRTGKGRRPIVQVDHPSYGTIPAMNDYRLLDQRGLTPKKSLGQNFMVEETVLRKMVDSADISPNDAVLEIGAGLGALTAYLADAARRVGAAEIDTRYAAERSYRFASQRLVEVVVSDGLKSNLAAVLG